MIETGNYHPQLNPVARGALALLFGVLAAPAFAVPASVPSPSIAPPLTRDCGARQFSAYLGPENSTDWTITRLFNNTFGMTCKNFLAWKDEFQVEQDNGSFPNISKKQMKEPAMWGIIPKKRPEEKARPFVAFHILKDGLNRLSSGVLSFFGDGEGTSSLAVTDEPFPFCHNGDPTKLDPRQTKPELFEPTLKTFLKRKSIIAGACVRKVGESIVDRTFKFLWKDTCSSPKLQSVQGRQNHPLLDKMFEMIKQNIRCDNYLRKELRKVRNEMTAPIMWGIAGEKDPFIVVKAKTNKEESVLLLFEKGLEGNVTVSKVNANNEQVWISSATFGSATKFLESFRNLFAGQPVSLNFGEQENYQLSNS